MTRHRYLYLLMAVFISSCSTTKYLAPGQKLYTGAKVNITDKNTTKSEAGDLKDEMEGLLRPKPNATILGLRFKLWVYFKTRTNKKKGLRHYLNTHFGEPPVLVSSVDLDKNAHILQSRLQNESYFLAQVNGDTVSKKKTSEAIYTVQTGPAYHYRKIGFPTGDDDLDTAVAGTSPKTLLKPGDKFNLDIIKAERVRIDARLKEEGFFYFAPEDLIMRYDSTVKNHQIDMYVTIKPATPDEARWIYHVRNIYVYPNYSLKDTSLKQDSAVRYRWYNVVDPKNTIHPYAFKNTVLLHPGDIYNRTEHNNSLSRFIELGPYRFVKNRFEDVTPDSALLDIYYFLTPQKKKSLQAEILVRQTSANYDGTQLNLNFRDRNTFKGAELYTLNFSASRDVQFGKYNAGYNVYQFGVKPTLSWPRFISPFNFNSDNAFIPRTNFSLGYTLIDRSKLYNLNSFMGSWGYTWKPGLHTQHEFDLLSVTYVQPSNVSKIYTDSISKTGNPALAHVIDKQFTFGPSYSYTFTNTTEDQKVNTYYYSSKLSLSGNLLGIVTGADTLHGKVSKLFGTPFNQYIKLENEVRYFHKLSTNSKLATRLMVDVGLPYGNSTILPYTQQFFIGGANSLRGFQAHSIGPGTYIIPEELTTGTNFLPDESGDIKIEANVEYRAKLFSVVNGALFMDAGNIWDMRSHPDLPGAAFSFTHFINQMAVDWGFGLRFDFTVLLLRTDLGFPVRYPFPAGQPYKFNFHSPVLNLAIGYPF
ncbi:MAG TPA: BamA/TamA family outer membrane protein [Mucilaginibacter sp.]|nr:BamA/TamA family outer membrane protein [Mucilaginibacter sp.]